MYERLEFYSVDGIKVKFIQAIFFKTGSSLSFVF